VAAGVLRWDAVSWALAATTLLASASAAGEGDWAITSVLHDAITIHRGNHGIPPSLS